MGAAPSDPSKTLRLALSAVIGAYENASGSGQYQGLVAEARYRRPWLWLALVVPGYRIERAGTENFGLGDIAMDVRLNALERVGGGLSGGVALATSAPTGNAKRGLGMGHVMLMGGVWAQLQTGAVTLGVDVRYGSAIGATMSSSSSGHAGHGTSATSLGPVVQPMNRSEVELALSFVYRLTEHVAPFARTFGAVPVADVKGAARQAIAAGVALTFGALDFFAEAQVPVVGDPFTARVVAGIGGGW